MTAWVRSDTRKSSALRQGISREAFFKKPNRDQDERSCDLCHAEHDTVLRRHSDGMGTQHSFCWCFGNDLHRGLPCASAHSYLHICTSQRRIHGIFSLVVSVPLCVDGALGHHHATAKIYASRRGVSRLYGCLRPSRLNLWGIVRAFSGLGLWL